MNKEVVKELIQYDLNKEKITLELNKILVDGEKRTQILQDYKELKELLSKGGDASNQAAVSIYNITK